MQTSNCSPTPMSSKSRMARALQSSYSSHISSRNCGSSSVGHFYNNNNRLSGRPPRFHGEKNVRVLYWVSYIKMARLSHCIFFLLRRHIKSFFQVARSVRAESTSTNFKGHWKVGWKVDWIVMLMLLSVTWLITAVTHCSTSIPT